MKKTSVIIVMSIMIYIESFAQEKLRPIINWNIAGQVSILSDFRAISYLNIGGPNIRFIKNKNYVGLSFLPSLRLANEVNRPFFTPTTGFGLELSIKHIIFTSAFFYNSSAFKWKYATGIGYRFKI